MRGTAVPQGVSPLRDQSLVLGSHVGAATTRRPSRDAAGRRHPGTTAPACGSHVTRRLSTEKTLAVNDREQALQALQALDDSVIVGTDGEISTVGQVYTDNDMAAYLRDLVRPAHPGSTVPAQERAVVN